jgi:large subunit ribosomal protein L21
MTDYAVIKTGGKQYLVMPGDKLKIEKIDSKKDKEVVFDQVLLTKIKEKLAIGKPFLKNVKVKARVLEQEKGEKVRVAKFKAKSRYRKVQGHRQLLTAVEILAIT